MIKAIEIITLFPDLFVPLLNTRIFEKAKEKIDFKVVNLREFSTDKHKTVDDTPYGGGCGMILKPEPLASVLDSFKKRTGENGKVIYLSPQGKLYNQNYANELLEVASLALICGRYEGIDQRIIDLYVDEELSIGDYILAGGELAAMAVTESLLRLIPGVLGNEESPKKDSFSEGLLKYPQYTRPEKFKDIGVPGVLLSGDHGKIAKWRKEESLKRTEIKRPDLFLKFKERNSQ